MNIAQWEPYEMAAEVGGWEALPTATAALTAAAHWAERQQLTALTGAVASGPRLRPHRVQEGNMVSRVANERI